MAVFVDHREATRSVPRNARSMLEKEGKEEEKESQQKGRKEADKAVAV